MAYSDVTDYGPLLRIITISFLAPTSVIFFWRIISKFSRDRRLNAFGVDDVMLILAMVCIFSILLLPSNINKGSSLVQCNLRDTG